MSSSSHTLIRYKAGQLGLIVQNGIISVIYPSSIQIGKIFTATKIKDDGQHVPFVTSKVSQIILRSEDFVQFKTESGTIYRLERISFDKTSPIFQRPNQI